MSKATGYILLALFTVTISGSYGSEDEVMENCIKNSGNSNYEYHLFAKHFELIECAKKYGHDDGLNLFSGLQRASMFFSQEQLQSFLTNNCPKLTKLVSCADAYLQEYNVCFEGDETQLALIKSLPSKISSLSNYICENNGENYMNFMLSNGSAFMWHSDTIIKACLPANFTSQRQSFKNIYPMFKAPEETVSDHKTITDCIINGAETHHYSKSFFEEVFAIIDADFIVGVQTLAYEPGFWSTKKSTSSPVEAKKTAYRHVIDLYKDDASKSEMIEYLTDFVKRL